MSCHPFPTHFCGPRAVLGVTSGSASVVGSSQSSVVSVFASDGIVFCSCFDFTWLHVLCGGVWHRASFAGSRAVWSLFFCAEQGCLLVLCGLRPDSFINGESQRLPSWPLRLDLWRLRLVLLGPEHHHQSCTTLRSRHIGT